MFSIFRRLGSVCIFSVLLRAEKVHTKSLDSSEMFTVKTFYNDVFNRMYKRKDVQVKSIMSHRLSVTRQPSQKRQLQSNELFTTKSVSILSTMNSPDNHLNISYLPAR